MVKDIGIYLITCLPTQMMYVGQSINIKSRWNQHLNELRNNKHGNSELQEDFLKYGEVNFAFEIIALCAPEALNMLESYYVKKYGDLNKSYNVIRGGGGRYKPPIELTLDEYRIVGKFKENEKVNIPSINPYICLIKILDDNGLARKKYINAVSNRSGGKHIYKFVHKEGNNEIEVNEVLSVAYLYMVVYIDLTLKEQFKEIDGIVKFIPKYKESDLDKKNLILECEVIKTGEKFNKNIYF